MTAVPLFALCTLALAACSQQDTQSPASARARSVNQAKATTTLSALSSSIVVTPSTASDTTNATLLASQLVGSGVSVSNAELTGAAPSSGSFTGGTTAFGFPNGVILS